MTTKHTPGPYSLNKMGEWPQDVPVVRATIGRTKWVIAKIIGPERVYGDIAEIYANARLFAAAPDLLEALENLILYVPGGIFHSTSAIKQARAAIAKATDEGMTP